MSKAKSSGFPCPCCCPSSCCDPATSQDKEALIIEVYQPVVPTKKQFSYPQQGLEKQVSLVPVVTSQPTASDGLAHSHTPHSIRALVFTSQPAKTRDPISRPSHEQKLGVRGQHGQRPQNVPIAKEVHPASTPVSSPSLSGSSPTPALTHLSAPAIAHHDATLEFNLYFDSHRESLCVHIHRGLYFLEKRGSKSVNSFVMAFLVPSQMQTLKTRLISDSRSPAFDQVLEFSGLSLTEYRKQTLILQIFYRDSDDTDTCVACSCTKLQDINLMESNQLTKSIDGHKDILELSQSGQMSLNEELQQLMMSDIKESPSELFFTIYYNSQLQELCVHLKHIVNLPTKLPEESSNPYVQIYLLSRKLKAKDIYTSHKAAQTHQPTFDCMAVFNEVSMKDLDSEEVVFRIYLNGEMHFLGGVVHSMNLYGSTVTAEILTFPEEDSLKDNLQGDLLLTLCYQPEGKKIVVTILEVKRRNPYSIHESSSNPYVKVNLLHEGERVSKWKTSTKRGSMNPVYRESRELDLEKLGMRAVELNVKLMNSDHFGRHHEIGKVKFGEDVHGYRTGQNHWNKFLVDPNTPVTAWHPVFPSPSAPHRKLLPGMRSRSISPQLRSRSPVFKHKHSFGLQV